MQKNSSILVIVFSPCLSGGSRIISNYVEALANSNWTVNLLIIGQRSVSHLDAFVSRPDFSITVLKSSLVSFLFFAFLNRLNLLRFYNFLIVFTGLNVKSNFASLKKMFLSNLFFCGSWQPLLLSILAKPNFNFQSTIYLIQHDDAIISGRRGIRTFINTFLFRLAYLLPVHRYTVSSWLSNRLFIVYGITSKVISNSLSPSFSNLSTYFHRSFLPNTIDSQKVLIIAKDVSWKGLSVLKDYLLFLFSTPRQPVVTIVSQSSMKSIINIFPQVNLIRPLNDSHLKNIFLNSTLFVFLSSMEGFGLPPLEAMAFGLPVITVNCGGVLQFAVNDYNCVLIPPNDAHSAYLATHRVFSDLDLSSQLSLNAANTASRFNFQHFMLCVHEEFSTILRINLL